MLRWVSSLNQKPMYYISLNFGESCRSIHQRLNVRHPFNLADCSMKKPYGFALIGIVVVLVILTALLINSMAKSPVLILIKEVNPSPDFSVSDVSAVSPHYLSRPPYYPNNTDKSTKIFLESATLWYDKNSSITSDLGYDLPKGSSALVINGTIRNDYTREQIVRWTQAGKDSCYIGLDLYVYEKQGNVVSIIERGNPLRGCFELSLRGSESASFNMIFDTQSRNFAYYEIYVEYLDPAPQF
jgi:hypothetical protein